MVGFPLVSLARLVHESVEAVSRKETRLFACGSWLDSVKAMALWGFSITADQTRRLAVLA